MSTPTAVQIAITFVWLGMVLAISFLEAPLKFRAPNVTLQIGLGISNVLFHLPLAVAVAHNAGGAGLLIMGSLLLLGHSGMPQVDAQSAAGRGLLAFCRRAPAIAWAVVLFAAFEAMVLTLLPTTAFAAGELRRDKQF